MYLELKAYFVDCVTHHIIYLARTLPHYLSVKFNRKPGSTKSHDSSMQVTPGSHRLQGRT